MPRSYSWTHPPSASNTASAFSSDATVNGGFPHCAMALVAMTESIMWAYATCTPARFSNPAFVTYACLRPSPHDPPVDAIVKASSAQAGRHEPSSAAATAAAPSPMIASMSRRERSLPIVRLLGGRVSARERLGLGGDPLPGRGHRQDRRRDARHRGSL